MKTDKHNKNVMKPVWFREQLVILDCLLEVQPLEEYEKVKDS